MNPRREEITSAGACAGAARSNMPTTCPGQPRSTGVPRAHQQPQVRAVFQASGYGSQAENAGSIPVIRSSREGPGQRVSTPDLGLRRVLINSGRVPFAGHKPSPGELVREPLVSVTRSPGGSISVQSGVFRTALLSRPGSAAAPRVPADRHPTRRPARHLYGPAGIVPRDSAAESSVASRPGSPSLQDALDRDTVTSVPGLGTIADCRSASAVSLRQATEPHTSA